MLYTYEKGQRTNPAIIFLHGGGLSSTSWLPVIERLGEFYCLAPDLPEHGRSKDVPYSISASAEGAAEVIRSKVPSRKAHVVALSLGGPAALTLLRIAPELVDHADLSGSSGHFPRFLSSLGTSTIWMYRFFSKEYLFRQTLRQHGIPDAYADLVRDDLAASTSPAFMGRFMSELSRWELPARVERPLLFAVGEKEPWGSMGITRGYIKRYPSAKAVVVPGAKHAWSLQLPDLFSAMVRAWVTDRPLPAELGLIPFRR
jgi:pimeloyl-ACP methyl ester carboxylesterase